MNRFVTGFELGLKHVLALAVPRFGLVLLGVSAGFTTLFSVISKNAGASAATTQALLGPVFGIAVPLGLFIYARHLGRLKLHTTATTASLLGVSRSAFGGGAILSAAAFGAAFAMVLALLSVFLIRNAGDPARLDDLFKSGWIGLLGGAAYACLFTSLADRRGLGPFAFLLADWFLGAGSGIWSLFWPRAHIANLLGGPAPLPATIGLSVLMLWGLCALGCAVFLVRLNR